MPTTKSYYELLGVDPTAPAEEIKRAFRQQIARYHPDKVQHLGKEFQDMAAERAAELTEAYRILSDVGRRDAYDRAREAGGVTVAAPAAAASPTSSDAARAPSIEPEAAGGPAAQFTRERASRDVFVKKAMVGRFRDALTATLGGGYDDSQVQGFDVACAPRSKLFARTKGPGLLARFVPCADGPTVTDTWARAAKWTVAAQDEICVFLIGSSMAPPGELADAIAAQRRKPARGAKVTLIPVDMRDWDAHVPTDAPAVARTLLARLKTGT